VPGHKPEGPTSIPYHGGTLAGGSSANRGDGPIVTRLGLILAIGGWLLLALSCSGPAPAGLGSGAAVTLLPSQQSSDAVNAPELLGFSLQPEWHAASQQRLRGGSGGTCGSAYPSGMAAGKTALRTLTSGSLKRTYRVHIPAQAKNDRRLPLVLNFHGRSGTGIDQEITSGLLPLSDREGFILVSPDGTGTPMGWSAGATAPNSIDDVRFVSDLLDTLQRELCVDTARVYATGFSNGAFMTSRLACAMPDRIAAVVAVGGVDFPGATCNSTIPVLAIHGTADDVVPIDGGIVREWQYQGANVSIEEWAANNGCRAVSAELTVATGVTAQSWADCSAPTAMIRITGAGHMWPGAPGYAAGSPGTNISGADIVWRFLSQGTVAVRPGS